MATATVRPASDYIVGASGGYDRIDEVVTQPAAGDGLFIHWTEGSSGNVAAVTMGTVSDLGKCTQISVWGYVPVTSITPISCNVYIAGRFISGTSLLAGAWTNLVINGNFDKMEMSQLRLHFNDQGLEKDEDAYLDTAYADLTYTPGPGSNFFMMGCALLGMVLWLGMR